MSSFREGEIGKPKDITTKSTSSILINPDTNFDLKDKSFDIHKRIVRLE